MMAVLVLCAGLIVLQPGGAMCCAGDECYPVDPARITGL